MISEEHKLAASCTELEAQNLGPMLITINDIIVNIKIIVKQSSNELIVNIA
jgi:hypothetical protein